MLLPRDTANRYQLAQKGANKNVSFASFARDFLNMSWDNLNDNFCVTDIIFSTKKKILELTP